MKLRALVALLPALVAGWGVASELPPVPVPAAFDALWLEEVALFITEEERAFYLSLTLDREREAFRREFWRARDEAPRSPLIEIKEHALHNLAMVRQNRLHPAEARGRALLLLGPPEKSVSHGPCGPVTEDGPGLFNCVKAPSFELYVYPEETGIGTDPLLFVDHDGECRLYRRGFEPPFRFEALRPELCLDGPPLADWLRGAMRRRLDWEAIEQAGMVAPPQRDWIDELRERLLEAEPETEEPGPAVTVDAGTSGRLSGRLRIPVPERWRGKGLPWHNLFFRLDLYDGDQRVAASTHLLTIPAGPRSHLDLSLQVEASVRPLTLVAHVEDEAADMFFTRAFLVSPHGPGSEDPSRATALGVATPSHSLPGSIAAFPSIGIEMLDGLQTGLGPVRLATWGDGVHRVTFALGDETVGEATEPPFEVDVDFGPLPREWAIQAHGFDAEGRLIGSDRAVVNRGAHHFGVDLFDATPPSSDRFVVRGRAYVPATGTLDRIELFEGEDLVEEYREPSFTFSRPLTSAEQRGSAAAVLKSVIHLRDGRSVEDTLLLSKGPTEQVDVDLVEMFIGVVDRNGRPITDLTRGQLTVHEDGRRQELRLFEHSSRLPINVLLLLDTSSSMSQQIAGVRTAGLSFLEQVIRDDDRAALLSFSHRVYVVVPFTNDLEELRAGSQGLRAWGATSFHDSAAMALYYLQGLEGKKALVLVTDGLDRGSDLGYRQLLEYAERTGISVYALRLGGGDVDRREAGQTRSRLRRLARRTGGRFFSLSKLEELPEIYRQIETDLRSQYFVAYESTAGGSRPGEYREIRVEVAARGAKVHSRPGYYP